MKSMLFRHPPTTPRAMRARRRVWGSTSQDRWFDETAANVWAISNLPARSVRYSRWLARRRLHCLSFICIIASSVEFAMHWLKEI
jgi:hypothetical protein